MIVYPELARTPDRCTPMCKISGTLVCRQGFAHGVQNRNSTKSLVMSRLMAVAYPYRIVGQSYLYVGRLQVQTGIVGRQPDYQEGQEQGANCDKIRIIHALLY